MIKGFKVFNPNWTCRDFQYEVGQTYEHKGNIELCGSGFHFCRKASDCFKYYNFDSNNKVAEVEALGLVESDETKSVTNKIRIVRELTWHEVLELVNTGKDCTGRENSGDWNSGDWNSGNWNSGNRNSGNGNSGNRNSGDWNSGDWNSGDWNSGNWNSGDWNSGDGNSGVFCTENPKIKIFDIETDMTINEWRNTRAAEILYWNFESTVWIYAENMTEEEKKQHLDYETLGGYLKVFEYKEACRNMWNVLTDKEKQEIKNIPNFNAKKFEEITGIKVE
ncbi:pentapeptide repeat-containing protein [Tissierella sp. MSJ-40]|uniref:Pentapeptide repeat-containing protein n=1 Tax=Tissierella simiarum TaxID=2841534 RepID=A0ABS6ECU0_9FIRM|nr:pentapeptide repeat-containing protein [Tissierella simiarum]MBU5440275.1 pentapeptide repeat-containing protein [Tissierella simiarum]